MCWRFTASSAPHPGKGPLALQTFQFLLEWRSCACVYTWSGAQEETCKQRQQTQWQLLILGETCTSDIGWPGMTSGGQGPACMGVGRCTEADRWTDWSKHWENTPHSCAQPGYDHLTDLSPHHQLLPSPLPTLPSFS